MTSVRCQEDHSPSHQYTLLVYDKPTMAISCICDRVEALKSRMVFVSIPLLRFRNKPNHVHLPEPDFASSQLEIQFYFMEFLGSSLLL